ncbi:MAG: hypothetical protein Tsb008_08740 [Rhodothalassiaceae bacterium]
MRGLLMLSTAVFALGASAPAFAQTDDDAARIDVLERQLRDLMGLVGRLNEEIASLKASHPAAAGQTMAVDEVALAERFSAVEAKVANTSARLDDVEEMAFDLDEKVGSRALLRAFDAKSFDLGGFFHTAATLVDGRDNTEAAVNRLTFELLAKAQLSDKWSLFVAQAFIRESNINYTDPFGRFDPNFSLGSAAPLVIATATYKHSDKLTVDFGRFITPHGIINIEHFPAILLDPEQPQFLRPFGGQTIFANFMNGVKASGQIFEPGGLEGSLGYSAYVGSFANNADSFNYGGRVFWQFGNSGATVGANVGGGRRAGEGTGYVLYGFDFLYDKGPFQWKNEVFVTDEDVGGNRLAFYSQPAWRFAKDWTAFYRFDFLDDGTDTGDRKEHAIGLTYKPIPQVHLRAIARLNRFDAAAGIPEASSENYQISATFSF